MEKKRGVLKRNAELCTAVQLLFKSPQTTLGDAWNHVQSSRDSTDRHIRRMTPTCVQLLSDV